MSQLVLAKEARVFGVGVVRSGDEKVCVHFRMREQPADHVRVVGAVIGHFLDRPLAEVVVTGEARVACLVKLRCPECVIARGVFIGAVEPLRGLFALTGRDLGS